MTGSIFDNRDLDIAIELYHSAEQIAGIGSYEIRLATGEMVCSENLCVLLGHKKPAITCTLPDFLAIVHPDDKPGLQQHFEKSLVEHTPFDIEFRAVRIDGTVRVFYQKCKVLSQRNGGSSIVGIVQDITERRQAELAAREQAYFISKVAETSPDLMSVFNLVERKFEYINHKNPEIYGYTDEEMMNMDLANQLALMHPDDLSIVREYFASLETELTDTAHTIEYRATDKDGSWLWFRARGKVFKRDAAGKPTHCLSVIHNITDRKHAEADLRKHEALLTEAERIASMGSWVRDVKTNELLWSEGLYRLYGLEPSNVPPSSEYFLQHIVHPDDRDIAAKYIDSLWKANTEAVEYRILRPDGEERWVCVKAQMEFGKDGSLAFIRGISSDVTAQKRADQELRNLNKALVRKNKDLYNLNAELASVANLTGQELKEPLRKVYTFLETIANKDIDRLSEIGRVNLRKAQAALQRMSLLTDDILTFTDIGNQKETRSKVDLNLVVGFVMKNLKDKIERSGTMIDKDPLPTVKGYRTLISTLVYHLIDNAIRFQDDSARPCIRITASIVQGADIGGADAVEENDYTKLEFIDNGLGFSQLNGQMFSVSSQMAGKEKSRGASMGLAICKKIVDKHHGFITAANEEEGATFTIYLPA
ncbi:MAG: domain S-box protein [Flavipsychrobacter sp.]|jgi:PAS domain S-box-containing protein|nr:domain S-box protein [Flavipsychrobacter sp.]